MAILTEELNTYFSDLSALIRNLLLGSAYCVNLFPCDSCLLLLYIDWCIQAIAG